MHILRNLRRRPLLRTTLPLFCLMVLASCAPLVGYPKDPEDTDATLTTLKPYFDGTKDTEYAKALAADRTRVRNEIIFARLRAYDIVFADFEKKLYGDGNAVTLGSDLIGLALAGLTATTGTAATKSALGAVSGGVLGANTAMNKDLYYQKTIPALLAQMEAGRVLAKAPIVVGMKVSDTEYPLIQAYIDLDAYKNAGSIPAAINAINKDAGNAKDDAIVFQRASAQDELVQIVSIQSKLKSLTADSQFVALAKAMQPFLASRPQQIQALVKSLDPKGLRLTGNAKKARQVINAWVGMDSLSPANQQQWLDAIAASGKGS